MFATGKTHDPRSALLRKHSRISHFPFRHVAARFFKERIEFWLNANVMPAHIMFVKFRNVDGKYICSGSSLSLGTRDYNIKVVLGAQTESSGKKCRNQCVARDLLYAVLYCHYTI